MTRLLTLMALLISLTAQAASTDFARGLILDTADGRHAHRVLLPDELYVWVTRADLGDVRVLNRDQEEMPYTLRRPQGSSEYSSWAPVPLFPLPAPDLPDAGSSRLEIQVDDLGTVLSVAGASPDSPHRAYLLDLSSLATAPMELKLQWQPQGREFVSRVRLETSNDLDNWRPLLEPTTVAELRNDAQAVRLDRLVIPARKAQYLRIVQTEGNEPLELQEVSARHRTLALPQRRFQILTPEAGEPEWFSFDVGGFYPIDRVRVVQDGGAGNYLITVRLQSRNDEDAPWRERGLRTFYRTTIAGRVAQAEPLKVADSDRFWRFSLEGASLTEPRLEAGWLPDELVFLAQGAAPYVLAYGQADLEGRPWPLTELLRQLNWEATPTLDDLPEARLGTPEMLGGPERLLSAPDPIDWQTIVLWAVLLLGVLVVGVFAIRLLRE
ncbi:MAG: DUF3999 family protein [Pseudomonadota bacterium]